MVTNTFVKSFLLYIAVEKYRRVYYMLRQPSAASLAAGLPHSRDSSTGTVESSEYDELKAKHIHLQRKYAKLQQKANLKNQLRKSRQRIIELEQRVHELESEKWVKVPYDELGPSALDKSTDVGGGGKHTGSNYLPYKLIL